MYNANRSRQVCWHSRIPMQNLSPGWTMDYDFHERLRPLNLGDIDRVLWQTVDHAGYCHSADDDAFNERFVRILMPLIETSAICQMYHKMLGGEFLSHSRFTRMTVRENARAQGNPLRLGLGDQPMDYPGWDATLFGPNPSSARMSEIDEFMGWPCFKNRV